MLTISDHANEQLEARGITVEEIEAMMTDGARWWCPRQPAVSYVRRDRLFAVFLGTNWLVTAYWV